MIEDMLGRVLAVGDVVANGMRDGNDGKLQIYRILAITPGPRNRWTGQTTGELRVELLAGSGYVRPDGKPSTLRAVGNLLKLPKGWDD